MAVDTEDFTPMRSLFTFDSTATGAIAPSITDDSAITPIFTTDGGTTFDTSALAGGTTTVQAFGAANSNISTVALNNVSLDINSLPPLEIEALNPDRLELRNNSLRYTEIRDWINAATGSDMTVDFKDNVNEILATYNDAIATKLSEIRVAGGDIELNLFGSIDGVGTTNTKWTNHNVVASNDKHYCTPSNSDDLLEIDVPNETFRLIATGVGTNAKCRSSGLANGNHVYFTPARAGSMIRYDHVLDMVELFAHGYGGNTEIRFRGIPFEYNNRVYIVPHQLATGERDMKCFDLGTETFSDVSLGLTGTSTIMWGGTHVGSGVVVFTPAESGTLRVYEIDIDTISTYATGETASGKILWRFNGVLVGDDIYFAPNASTNILKFNVTTRTVTLIPTGMTGTISGGIPIHYNGVIYIPTFLGTPTLLTYDIALDVATVYTTAGTNIRNKAVIVDNQVVMPMSNGDAAVFDIASKTLSRVQNAGGAGASGFAGFTPNKGIFVYTPVNSTFVTLFRPTY